VLAKRLLNAGFRGARVTKLSFGLVAVHEARK